MTEHKYINTQGYLSRRNTTSSFHFFVFIFLLLFVQQLQANNDSVPAIPSYPETTNGLKFSSKQVILPGVLLAAGIYGTIRHDWDQKISDQAAKWNGDTQIDNILPFVAPASVYALNWCGVRGKHNFVDRSVILGTAAVLSLGTTQLLKSTISTPRPDGDGDDSFPSMHTATAFMGAEFLWQEYRDQSPWYGIAGYTLATATGFLRIYNDRHYLSDVLAGAGIGILGTKAAYWLYPQIRKLYAGTILDRAMIIPFGSSQGMGLSVVIR